MDLYNAKTVFERAIKARLVKPEGVAAHNCEYYIGGQGREFCKATTQTSCRRCRAYQPNDQERRGLIAEYIESKEKQADELTDEVARMQEKISKMEDAILDFRVFAKLVEREAKELAGEPAEDEPTEEGSDG